MRISLLPAPLAAALALTLCACAPVDTGNKQCSDVNINLVIAKDAKYTTLAEAEGGLSAAQVALVDSTVTDFMATHATPVAGCAVGITQGDHISYLNGYGVADLATQRPFTYATPSAIGSISKTLTALAALRLEIDTELSQSTHVYAALGQPSPPHGDPTLEQVLAHTGGFAEDPSFAGGPFNNLATITNFYSNQGIAFPSLQPTLVFPGYGNNPANQPHAPGGLAEYSNTGYMIAGTLIDQRSRGADIPATMRGYERYIWNKVARGTSSNEPTMVSACLNTSFRQPTIKDFARGYGKENESADFSATGAGWGYEGPPGGWSMTIGDLARLGLILQSDAVIPKTMIDDTMRVDYGPFGDKRIGLGLELSATTKDGTWFGKGGNIRGYTADLKVWPNGNGQSLGIATMCNQSGSDTDQNLAILIHRALTGTQPPFGGGLSTGRNHPNGSDSSLANVAKAYEPLVRRYADSYLAEGGSPERAWALARRELLTLGNGRSVVAYLDTGDIVNAVRLLPTLRYADGSPVTP